MTVIDKEWEDGDDSALEDEAYSSGFSEGFDEGFALALGMVLDYVQSNGDINTTNAVEVMNSIAKRRGE
jgi:hypothetical protein